MPLDQLSTPGGATYSSQILHVGDGTWDSTTDDLLLPNIMGLNYETMRYNGMGNRFSTLAEYHTLILGHGILAAITFLGIVPAAILVASFYYRNPRLALRVHIYLQILTVILATIVLVLGYFAVGPTRSLTNPHHGIGVAIYVLVVVQAIGGALVHRIEKGKVRYYIPIKLMLHQWLGRAIALLALAQIPIGLALYGAPLYLFVLYAISMFALLLLYFVLTYQRHKRAAMGYDAASSIIASTQTTMSGYDSQLPQRDGVDSWATPSLGGAGLAALRRRLSGREKRLQRRQAAGIANNQSQFTEQDESIVEEKQRTGHTWNDRFWGAVGGVGAFEALRRFTGRRNDERSEVSDYSRDDSSYQHTTGPVRSQSKPMTHSELEAARIEEGRPLNANTSDDWQRVEALEAAQAAAASRPNRPLRSAAMPAHATDLSQTTIESRHAYQADGRHASPYESEQGDPSVFQRFLFATGLSGIAQRRKERKQEARLASQSHRQYDPSTIRRDNESQPLVRPLDNIDDARVPNVQESPSRPGAGQYSAGNFRPMGPAPTLMEPVYSSPWTSPTRRQNGATIDRPHYGPAVPGIDGDRPPPPPTHHDFAYNSSGSPITRNQASAGASDSLRNDSHRSPPSQRQSPRVAFAPGTAPGSPSPLRMNPSAPPLYPQESNTRLNSSTSLNAATAPPVSLHVRHSAEHVHVRRLSPQGAATQREAMRRVQENQTMPITAAIPGQPSTPSRQDPQQSPYAVLQHNSANVPTTFNPLQPTHSNLPQHQASPPPQAALSGIASSPSAYAATDTSNYDLNRRRRRAERARAEQARQAVNTGRDGRIDYS